MRVRLAYGESGLDIDEPTGPDGYARRPGAGAAHQGMGNF
jgi:hypothetical protein